MVEIEKERRTSKSLRRRSSIVSSSSDVILIHVRKGAIYAKTDIQFDALFLDERSGVNTYPCLKGPC